MVEENALDDNQTEHLVAVWGGGSVRPGPKLQSARVLYRYLCLQWCLLIGEGADEASGAQISSAIVEQEQALARLLDCQT